MEAVLAADACAFSGHHTLEMAIEQRVLDAMTSRTEQSKVSGRGVPNALIERVLVVNIQK